MKHQAVKNRITELRQTCTDIEAKLQDAETVSSVGKWWELTDKLEAQASDVGDAIRKIYRKEQKKKGV